ncbi:uncharacterized protein LOC120510385 isoform X2 [Passer montanus]|uniref:uncharacterized protein LOC120510385 isoform X2 n=1 Tax=Passer montanus TaxID=9160 RepID=UPI001960A407|nr:uncharacterized protein LOC120510385 isoform X2 [Passer montanus]XP_039582117.1 uncharacterized protein LOC120510385 isoform X2 [Passer montanus]
MAELAGHRAGSARGGSPVPREEEHSWAQLPGSRPRPGHWSSSSSVCTEDFAVAFWEGMVEPLLCQQEPAGDVPTAGAHPGQDQPLFPTGRSLDTAMEPGRAPGQDRSPSRSSLESLGARISRLSQSHGGVVWGVPWPGPPARPALGHRDSARGELLATALPGRSWRAAGIAAGRSRAGARTGSPGSSVPRASSARTRAHPALGPPALGGRGGNVTFSVAAMDREGAARSRSAGSAMGAPGRWGSPVSPGLRGDQKGELPCKGVAGQPLCWSLRRSREGTRELGSGAKPWSPGHRARTGLALLGHTWDTHHRCHMDLQRMSWQGQGACVGQEWLDKERRKTATAQEEKLELLERLRELERGSRALLRQRLRVLQRLHGLLRSDRAETLRQLRAALERAGPGAGSAGEGRAGGGARREQLRSRLRDPAVPGRAGGSPALGTAPLAPRGHGPRPGGAVGPGPSPAAFGRALHALRGLRQQIQRRLGQWQRLQGALGAAGHRKEDDEQRQQPDTAPAPGAPREPLGQRQREHLHPTSSVSLSSIPGPPQPGRGSPGLLQHLQHHFQELQLEKTQSTGSPPALGGQPGVTSGPFVDPGGVRWDGHGIPGSLCRACLDQARGAHILFPLCSSSSAPISHSGIELGQAGGDISFSALPRGHQLDIWEKLQAEKEVNHWPRLPGQWWNHHPWKCPRNRSMWHFGMGFSGIWSKVGLDDLGGLFQRE